MQSLKNETDDDTSLHAESKLIADGNFDDLTVLPGNAFFFLGMEKPSISPHSFGFFLLPRNFSPIIPRRAAWNGSIERRSRARGLITACVCAPRSCYTHHAIHFYLQRTGPLFGARNPRGFPERERDAFSLDIDRWTGHIYLTQPHIDELPPPISVSHSEATATIISTLFFPPCSVFEDREISRFLS